MRIGFFAAGQRDPSARFRVMPYVPRLEASGYQCTVWHQWPSYGSALYANGQGFKARLYQLLGLCARLPRTVAAGRFDVVFLQRRMPGPLWPPMLERVLRRASKKLVFDFDDAIFSGPRAGRSFREITRFSDEIVAGSSLLAAKTGFPAKTTVIPTPVDTERFQPLSSTGRANEGRVTIGWTGLFGNYRFVYPLVPSLRRVFERIPQARLKLICDRPPNMALLSGLDVDFVRWQAEGEVEQLQDIDVGVMYLPDDEWARGKCGFKLIQYMAVGKPVVASPVGVNKEIVSHGVNGCLAESPGDWSECLTRLLQDADLRAGMGREGRRLVEQRYSVEACLPKLEAVLERAVWGSRADLRADSNSVSR